MHIQTYTSIIRTNTIRHKPHTVPTRTQIHHPTLNIGLYIKAIKMEQAYQSNNSPQNTQYWHSSTHGFGKTLNNAVTWISSLVSEKTYNCVLSLKTVHLKVSITELAWMDLVHVRQLWVQLLRLIHFDAFITPFFIIVYKNRRETISMLSLKQWV